MSAIADDVLRRSNFMRFVPGRFQESLRQLFQRQTYARGTKLARQGELAAAYYVVVTGVAQVSRRGEDGEEVAVGTLRAGDEFGESTLLAGGMGVASVRCVSTVEVWRMERERFLQVIREHPELREHLEMTRRYRALQGFFQACSQFGQLPSGALQTLIRETIPARFKRGELILRQGDPSGPMYIVEQGKVRVFAEEGGVKVHRAFYRAGDFFGELSGLTGAARAASVEAWTECALLQINHDTLNSLVRDFPAFRRLMEERRGRYHCGEAARMPLDFQMEGARTQEVIIEDHRPRKICADSKWQALMFIIRLGLLAGGSVLLGIMAMRRGVGGTWFWLGGASVGLALLGGCLIRRWMRARTDGARVQAEQWWQHWLSLSPEAMKRLAAAGLAMIGQKQAAGRGMANSKANSILAAFLSAKMAGEEKAPFMASLLPPVSSKGMLAAFHLGALEAEGPEQWPTNEPLLPVTTMEGSLELRDVGYREPETGQWILRGIHLAIAAGQWVAVVGERGSGKSVLLQLLACRLEPTEGMITVDRVERARLSYPQLRRQMGTAFEEDELMGRTVAEMVTWGEPSPDPARWTWAMEMAGTGTTSLTQPDDGTVVLGSKQFSTEEGARLRLARAWYRRPSVLIWDAAEERPVGERMADCYERLAQPGRSCTRITTAPRLNLVVKADLIVVMDRGEIAESGTHGELLARQGSYFELWRTEQSLPAIPAMALDSSRS